jgi:DNA-binding transcriptional ArsR family regulator
MPKDADLSVHERRWLPVAAAMEMAAHETRLAILEFLDTGPESVGIISEKLGLPRSKASRHLIRLAEGGLIYSEGPGWRNFYGLTERGAIVSALMKQVAPRILTSTSKRRA